MFFFNGKRYYIKKYRTNVQYKKVHPQREPKSPKRIKPTPTANTTKPTQQQQKKSLLPSTQ